ncbi:MAG: radical SAM protein, partial [Kofleriaceae bacterium]|nr:radical SAM protein [Kofleriaceae bacterium]
IREASRAHPDIEKVFVADGDALILSLDNWLQILSACRKAFPRLRQVMCYATAENVLEKSADELAQLKVAGLSLLYIGPESGDALTLKRIVKGASFDDHVQAANKAHSAGMKISVIMLLGAGGTDRSKEHAEESAKLISAMDPEYLAALTLTVVPNTPMARMVAKGGFTLPDPLTMLGELRTMIAQSNLSSALFRTNHASNYLPTGGRLPADKDRIVSIINAAIAGKVPLRSERGRGL